MGAKLLFLSSPLAQMGSIVGVGFKVLHKVYDFRRRFGYDMCVGCGRCDSVCPEYISFSGCVNKLAGTVDALAAKEVADHA